MADQWIQRNLRGHIVMVYTGLQSFLKLHIPISTSKNHVPLQDADLFIHVSHTHSTAFIYNVH